MAIAKTLFRFLLSILFILLVIGIFLPSNATLEKNIKIQASANKIFPHINEMILFYEWTPWNKISRNTEVSFEGKNKGIGAKIVWKNPDNEINNGNIVISKSEVDRLVKMNFNFGGKFQGESTFFLEQGSSNFTNMKWKIEAEFGWDLFSRYTGLLFEKIIGETYQDGLMDLKNKIERNE
tara:strand:- start:172 stop:711 length:540 start_codon:yes stop_codon:yes gene_type:complete